MFEPSRPLNVYGYDVVPDSIDIDGLALTPSKTILLLVAQSKFELLNFCFVAHWWAFRADENSMQLVYIDDASLPSQLCFWPRLRVVNFGHVWMLINGYIYQLCGETPTNLHMGVPAPTTNFDGWSVTLTETQRQAAINSTYK
jgi:hypothetical protein